MTTADRSAQRLAVEIAEKVLSGEIGVIEGAVRLASVAYDAVEDWRIDSDFVVFGGASHRKRITCQAARRASIGVERHWQKLISTSRESRIMQELMSSEPAAVSSSVSQMHNKRINFARVARPTRKERCSLLTGYARR